MDDLKNISGIDKNREDWFFVHDNNIYGPVCFYEVERLILESHIVANDLLWSKGRQSWFETNNFTNLSFKVIRKASEIEGSKKSIIEPEAKNLSSSFSFSFVHFLIFGIILFSGTLISYPGFLAKLAQKSDNNKQSVRVCNQTENETIFIALGSEHSTTEKWTANGWFSVKKGECFVPHEKMILPIYGFAKTEEGLPLTLAERSDKNFCVHNFRKFMYYDSICEQSIGSVQFKSLPFEKLAFFPELSEVRWLIK